MSKKGAVLTMIGFGFGMIVGCTTASVVADSPPAEPESKEVKEAAKPAPATSEKKKRDPIVVKLGDIPLKVAPTGMARATMFASGEEAYFGMLELEPGASVPEHADPTEEFIYVVEGQGIMMIDGVAHKVTPQTAIYMPAGAKVSFKNDRDRLVAFQVFGNPGPESKYDSWGTP
jgi:quercetin dioxygenase-like cupin family protein